MTRSSTTLYSPAAYRAMPPSSAASKKQQKESAQSQSKRASIFSFFTLKEPSQQALLEYEAHLKANSKTGRSVELANIPDTKLPPGVPKVNSKWDGVPDTWKERRDERSPRQPARSRSGSTSASSRGRPDSMASPESCSDAIPRLSAATRDKLPVFDSSKSLSSHSQSSLTDSRGRSESLSSQVTGRSTATSRVTSLAPSRSDVGNDTSNVTTPLASPVSFDGLRIDMGASGKEPSRLEAVRESPVEPKSPKKPSAGYALFPAPNSRPESRANAVTQSASCTQLPTRQRGLSQASTVSRPTTASRTKSPKVPSQSQMLAQAQAKAQAPAEAPPTRGSITATPRPKPDASIAPWDYMDDETIEKIVHRSPQPDKKVTKKKSFKVF